VGVPRRKARPTNKHQTGMCSEISQIQRRSYAPHSVGCPHQVCFWQPIPSVSQLISSRCSPVKLAKTRIWQDSAETLRKKRKETGKPIVVGGVSFTMTLV
jgi:hypothetical protein